MWKAKQRNAVFFLLQKVALPSDEGLVVDILVYVYCLYKFNYLSKCKQLENNVK